MSDKSVDQVTLRDRVWLEPIIGRMMAENAADLTDAEITRTLGPCVRGPSLIRAAIRLRDAGLLNPMDLRVGQVAPVTENGLVAPSPESARLTACTGSTSDRFAHPVQGTLL